MSQWFINGIRAGIKTTVYPRGVEGAAGVTPGLPGSGEFDAASAGALMDCCPAGVFSLEEGRVKADVRRCVHCCRCLRVVDRGANWEQTYEWAILRNGQNEFLPAFKKSIHICVVDAGNCGACLNEVRQLNNPYYNMHRLGFFITPTPRHGDILLVVGPVTDHMRFALEKTYNAMPAPRRVMAVGTCALAGGVFAESFVCAKGVADVLPVDVEVPGDPPPPLAILHGLLVAAGRKSPAAVLSAASETGAE
jgi:Ni,Fe-hydrogenase III small subunit